MSTKPKAMYVSTLSTIDQCRKEMARLYTQSRRLHGDELTADIAFKLASILGQVSKLIESSSIEERLAKLESQQPTPRRLGIA